MFCGFKFLETEVPCCGGGKFVQEYLTCQIGTSKLPLQTDSDQYRVASQGIVLTFWLSATRISVLSCWQQQLLLAGVFMSVWTLGNASLVLEHNSIMYACEYVIVRTAVWIDEPAYWSVYFAEWHRLLVVCAVQFPAWMYKYFRL